MPKGSLPALKQLAIIAELSHEFERDTLDTARGTDNTPDTTSNTEQNACAVHESRNVSAPKSTHQKSKNFKVAEDVAIMVAYMATNCGKDGRRNKERVHESFEYVMNMISNEMKGRHTHAEHEPTFPARTAKSVSRRVEHVVKSRILMEAMRQVSPTTPIDVDNFNNITVINVYKRYIELAAEMNKDVYVIPNRDIVRYTNLIKQNSNRKQNNH